jgi:hypothetical protein
MSQLGYITVALSNTFIEKIRRHTTREAVGLLHSRRYQKQLTLPQTGRTLK